ncbi:MAG: bifunctional phosphoribosyl-AMP cyclohydrolase/phosphoribosyl-ATP diphosphatase HisIE [Nitrospirae bacterium]|nr:bifunctional phosphoribosyl-AMP cyclohydrolase/phosphoribosyl-ATP diphosphatase HisIE [Nitrospirota bacterium]
MDVSQLRFDERGLIPAVVQDWRDGTVLMVGFMSREALEKTLQSGSVHFWSRSRNKLWEKGETSGHRLSLKDLFLDCDGDTLLVKAEPVGPTCHTGVQACFFRRLLPDGTTEAGKVLDASGGILERIYRTILERKRTPQADSYVSSLMQGGVDRILKKVVEEAGEVLLGSKNGKREEVIYEVADLFFHILVVLGHHEITPEDIYRELASRFGKTGLRGGPRDGRASGRAAAAPAPKKRAGRVSRPSRGSSVRRRKRRER